MTACPSAQKTTTVLPREAASRLPAPRENPDPAPAPKPPRVVQEAPKPAPVVDPVEDLISQVEKEYQAGLDNYQAGHLAAARQNFDRAFDLLTTSPYDIQADDRLQREFDRLVDGTGAMEVTALEQGDGFTQQKSEPAPIDEANDVTLPVDPGLKALAEKEVKVTRSDLPLMLTDQVVSYLNFYSSRGKGTLERALARAGRYEEMIRRILREEGLPEDLIYLAEAESGFHPTALSRAGARGMWQFMALRAKGYGLERNWWVDERQDPEKSTRAAARHLKDLYAQFGDWYLAMAAYNSGPGTIQSAVKRTGYADFWELYRRNVLPHETRNYVPIILAVTIMAKNRGQYGLDEVVPEPRVAYDTVTIDYPVDLRLVAECVDVPLSTLEDLNPSLLRMTTPKDDSFDLRLPEGTKDKFQQAIAAIPKDMRVWWRYHKVEADETMAAVSRTYKTSADDIVEANGLASDELAPGAKIIIPIAPGKKVPGETGEVYAKRSVRYRVRKGDTVLRVAANFGVPAEQIRRWNRLKGDHLVAGRTLRIYPLVRATPPGVKAGATTNVKKKPAAATKGRVLHKVRKGETLASIATTYKTTVTSLKRENPRYSTVLHPGDVLVVRAND
jgi:membrane-bound lytic murein transglycosylase D